LRIAALSLVFRIEPLRPVLGHPMSANRDGSVIFIDRLCRKPAIWTDKVIRYGVQAARISNCPAGDGGAEGR